MPTLEARIETDSPARIIARFCKHAASMGRTGGHGLHLHLGGPLARPRPRVHANCTDTSASVTFDAWGRCSMTADAGTLTLRIEAADEESLHRIRDIVTRDLDRFAGRGHPAVDWSRPEGESAT